MNISIILAEVSLIIFVFFLLDWLVGKVFKLLLKNVATSTGKGIKTLRRNTKSLILTCLVLCILIVAANGFLLYRGENLQQYTLLLIDRIPPNFG
jgi:small conductance mechanosensitive channel